MKIDPIKVLLIEDSPSDARLIQEMLRKAGASRFDLVHANRLVTGLETLAREEIGVILLDLNLPDSKGLETFSRVYGRFDKVPTVVLTGITDEELATRAVREGAQDYLIKSELTGNLLVRAMHYAIERQRSEEALRQAERKYRSIFENAIEGIFQTSMEGRFLSVNPAMCRILGHDSPEEVLAAYTDIQHQLYVNPEDREEILSRLKEKGQDHGFETQIYQKDGGKIWASITARAVRDSEGKILYLEGILSDISERKQAEQEMRKLNRTLAMLSECNETLIRAQDEEALLQDVCRIIVEIGGYRLAWVGFAEEDEEKTVRPVAFAGHEDGYLKTMKFSWGDNAWGQGATGRAIRTGEPAFAENILTDPAYSPWRDEAARRNYQSSIAIPLLISGKAQVALNLYSDQPSAFEPEEVKLLMELAADLAYGLEALRNREERQKIEEAFENLVSSAPMGIFIVADGKFKLVNPGFQKITGYGEKELLEKDSLSLVAPEFKEIVRENSMQMLAGKSIPPFEYQFIDKKGERKWVMETVTHTLYQGEIVVLGYFMELTERKRLESQLLQAQKMEAVGRLAGGVAHDFNNLLTGILGYGELMLWDLPDDDPRRHYLEEIMKTSERAAALTRQLLAFGRKQLMQPRIINLNELIADMEKMLRRLLGEDLDLITLLDPALGAVKADLGQMDQVIMNLAVNARDAMPRGGRLTIETENVFLDDTYAREHLEVVPGPYVMLAVSDTGSGMDAATQAHIFEPFFTTKEPGKGTGLGLSTVFGIIKQSGGHIWFYSELGKGTTFKIYLPRVEEAAKPLRPVVAPAASLRGSETILVVEDDEQLRGVICRTLRSNGYTVLEARHGSEAILVCGRHQGPIPLVLTDVVMPGLSGGELMERLAPLGRKMQVIFMSGYTEDTAALQGLLAAGVPFLEKPFKMITMLQKVREVLEASSEGYRGI